MSDQQNTSPKRAFGFVALFVAVLIGLVGGGLATAAYGHAHGGFGPRFGHWGGHHRWEDGNSPEHAKRHAERMVGHLAWAVDATPEQKQKLTAIAEALATDMQQMHTKMRDSHKRAIEIMRAPQVDRAALEAFRVEHLALADEASKRFAQALGDAADVLTPEQRAKLAQRWDF
jgi:Spy/CpxP family protein refolding chaperone